MKTKVSITLDSKLLDDLDALIDGIKIRNKSQAIEFLIKKSLSERKPAVILAGGPEEKLRAWDTYRPLIKIGKKTLIEKMIENLRKYKFLDIFIVGRKKILSEIFKSAGDGSTFGVNLNYIEEKYEQPITPLDTARTLKLLKGKINQSFLCINCDLVFDYDLDAVWNFFVKNGNVAMLLLKTTEQPGKYAVVEIEGNKILRLEEKPRKAVSYLVYTGMFIADPEIFKFPGNSLEHEIFPALAKKDLLDGYIPAGRSENVHSKSFTF